jgi:chromosome segregation ATPase
MAELQRRLETENKQRLKLEDDQLKRESELTTLRDRLGRTERELLKVGTDFEAIDAEVRLLRSRENKTIVEHVHVLEAAKRLTDRQLAEAKLELQSLTVYVKSLEKTKARDAEDLSRQGERERAAVRNQESVIKAAEERARLKLLKELQSSNENMATGISSQARSLLSHSNGPFSNGHHASGNQNQSSEKELAEAKRQIADFVFERKKLQNEAAQLKTKLEEQHRASLSKGESCLAFLSQLVRSTRCADPFHSHSSSALCIHHLLVRHRSSFVPSFPPRVESSSSDVSSARFPSQSSNRRFRP